jgi:uncharacterized protein (TIGR03437 family)
MDLLRVAALALTVSPLLLAQGAPNQLVTFKTSLGDIEVTLYPSIAPKTVANFLNYVNKQAYDNTFIHRTVRQSTLTIVQGGGYRWDGSKSSEIPADPAVANEFNLSNSRGTIAMALLSGDINSGTNQWFFNSIDNSGTLNPQSFTVFGRITSQAGLATLDKLQAVRAPNPAPLASPFDSIPLIDYTGGDVKTENLIIINSIRVIERPPQPAIRSESGAILASGFGGAAVAAPGAFIEVYGDNLAGEVSRSWAGSDFVNNRAPTSLEGASVSINGQPTFISYVSPTQLNVQIPANVPTGEPLPVVVSFRGVSSNPVMLRVVDQAGGLLAPASFKVGDKQYVVGVRPDKTLIANGIPGLPQVLAERGETLIFYGTGFGRITGTTSSLGGDIAQGTSRVVAPVQFKFGGKDARVDYAGLTPEQVGLYQFNVVVPADASSGDVEVQVIQAGTPIAQKLYIPVR